LSAANGLADDSALALADFSSGLLSFALTSLAIATFSGTLTALFLRAFASLTTLGLLALLLPLLLSRLLAFPLILLLPILLSRLLALPLAWLISLLTHAFAGLLGLLAHALTRFRSPTWGIAGRCALPATLGLRSTTALLRTTSSATCRALGLLGSTSAALTCGAAARFLCVQAERRGKQRSQCRGRLQVHPHSNLLH
jgi:hypothetical protein